MSRTHLRVSIALANAVPGAALRLQSQEGGSLIASNHPAADLRVDEVRATMLSNGGPDTLRLDQLVVETEVGGSLVPVGAGLYLCEDDGSPALWSAVPLSPPEIGEALDTATPLAIADHIEILLRPDPDLGVTSIRISSVLDEYDADVTDEDELADVAVHVLAACLAVELACAAGDRPRR